MHPRSSDAYNHNDKARAEKALAHGVVFEWKAKFGGLDVSEVKRLKALEDENAKLKRTLGSAQIRCSRGYMALAHSKLAARA